MNQVTATIELNQEKGTVKFSMDLQGDSELDHELLVAAIGSGRSVSIVPTHKANELFAEFTILDTSIWPKAMRALENRKRVLAGQPTVEEEQAQVAMRQAQAEDAEKASAKAEQKAIDDAAAKTAADDKRLADAVASGVAAGIAKAQK